MSDKKPEESVVDDENVVDEKETADATVEAAGHNEESTEEETVEETDANETTDDDVSVADNAASDSATKGENRRQDEAPATPARAPSVHVVEDELAAVGMFLENSGEEIDLDTIDLPPELDEPSFGESHDTKLSWFVFGLVVLIAVLAGAWVWTSDDRRIQVELMFEGGIVQHKRADIIALKEKYRKEDHYCQNRYGEFKMMYSPRDAEVTVTQITYKETIDEFMSRYIRGAADKRTEVRRKEHKKFKKLTEGLKKNQVVAEMNIKNLPVSQRTNPKDMSACTNSVDDYCTYVYKVKIAKDKYRPREFVIFSDYSPEAPGLETGAAQQLVFKKTGPSVFEVVWPGADLQPTPELFQEQYTQLMTQKVKCGMKAEGKKKELAELMALPEEERYQKIYESGLLAIKGKSWTLSEWRASIAELKQAENQPLWEAAQAAVKSCDCKAEPPCWKQQTTK